jgi:DNA-binding MarR family transcriptional regulator
MSVLSTAVSEPMAMHFALTTAPGHLIRRLHQLAVAQFGHSCAAFDLTSVQFAALTAISQQEGIDQSRLAQYLALDVVTIGSVLKRLEAKQLIVRTVGLDDKRKKCLRTTPKARQTLFEITPHASEAQHQILSPLNSSEQAQFIVLTNKLIQTLEAPNKL